MNLFVSSRDPVVAARALADRHVIKMTLETAQILSTALRAQGVAFPGQYRSTHAKHPSVLWAGADPRNLAWTVRHGLSLASEYEVRFGRTHKSRGVIEAVAPLLTDLREPDAFVFCGPDDLRPLPVTTAYRAFLRRKYARWALEGRPPRWTNADPPDWLVLG